MRVNLRYNMNAHVVSVSTAVWDQVRDETGAYEIVFFMFFFKGSQVDDIHSQTSIFRSAFGSTPGGALLL